VKVAHVYKDFFPPLMAGITRYLRDIADESARRGLDVAVHVAGVRRSRRDVLPSGVVVHRHRELARLLSAPVIPGLIRMSEWDADVLHVHMPNPSGDLGVALRSGDPPIVVSFHSQLARQRFLEPVYGPVRRRVLNRAAAVLVSSERMAAVPELAAVRSKVTVLPYGVSPTTVAGRHDDDDRDPRMRVLFVGRLVYYKGVDVLLEAAARVDQTSITIVGDGPLRGRLEGLARGLGIDQRTRFAGYVDDDALREMYATHDAFVLPSVSRSEAFGLSLAEAMANGLPVVSTRLGTGTDWVNAHDESGLVVPPGDVGALAAALEALCSPDRRRRLGAGARERATRLFSFSQHVDQLIEIYDHAVKAGH